MDLTKAAAVVMTHGGTAKDYAGDQVVPGPIHPLILIPTTSGTGSEVTAAAVLNDIQAGTKFGVLSNYIRPKVALVDPLLTISCPPSVTADSGLMHWTHAVEAFTAVDNETFPLPSGERTVYQGRHPMTDLMAEKAIVLIGQYLRRAVRDGKDLEAREGMSLAATTAGFAFSNCGVAVVHAMEYALAPIAHIPPWPWVWAPLTLCDAVQRYRQTGSDGTPRRVIGRRCRRVNSRAGIAERGRCRGWAQIGHWDSSHHVRGRRKAGRRSEDGGGKRSD